MPPDLQNRRFADIAVEKGIPPSTIYEHDLTGAAFKMTQLFDKNMPYYQAINHIGKRGNPVFSEKLENNLPYDAMESLFELISEAILKIDTVREEITRSFRINSEVIRLIVLEALEDLQNTELYYQVDSLTFDEFNQVITYARQNLKKTMRLLEA